MNRKHRGAFSELTASTWLLQHDYEVFRNTSQHGLADLIAWKPGEAPTLIDVKTVSEAKVKRGIAYTFQKLSQDQIAVGVKPLYVYHDGRVVWESPNDN